jgi:hypothetical protein
MMWQRYTHVGHERMAAESIRVGARIDAGLAEGPGTPPIGLEQHTTREEKRETLGTIFSSGPVGSGRGSSRYGG